MCEVCNHIATYQQLRQADPTKTNVLRANFVKDMNRRFNKIKKLIYTAVVTNDVFGLNPKIQANTGLPKKAFQFSTNPEKVEKFMGWLNRQVEQELLAVEFRSQLGSASQAPWTNMYISDSYKRGADRAAYEAKKAKIPGAQTVAERGGIEAVMGTPIHMDRLGMLYTRTFTELKGITAAMDSQISKVLAQGIADGDAPAAIARKLTKTIGGGLDLVTKTKAGIERLIPAQVRAQTLARTEVIRAHHAATIQEYRNFGMAGVKVQAEWSTAGFNVCDICKELEGKTFTLDEIEGMIPRHPNCRCIALPALDEGAEKDVSTEMPTGVTEEMFNEAIGQPNGWYSDIDDSMRDASYAAQTINAYSRRGAYVNYKLYMNEALDSFDSAFVRNLDKALESLPKYEGKVYRGIHVGTKDIDKFLTIHQPGNEIGYGAFLSTSQDIEMVSFSYTKGIQYEIKSKTGRKIRKFASIKEEEEVLFSTKSKFLVEKVEQIQSTSGSYYKVIMKEL